jgi:pentose-5-phosphate-3-epimerase
LAIDGGVNFDNAEAIRGAGATLLIAGTSAFGAVDMRGAVRRLRGE